MSINDYNKVMNVIAELEELLLDMAIKTGKFDAANEYLKARVACK